MLRVIFLLMVSIIWTDNFFIDVQVTPSCSKPLEQLSARLYLDTENIPDGFDRSTLIRLYDFLEEHVIADRRTPFPEQVNQLPVVIRYTSFIDQEQFPATTEDVAGWTDVVFADFSASPELNCRVSLLRTTSNQTMSFLVLVAVPSIDDPDYLTQLWGFTAHEIAHTFGAVHGPRFPFYEDDKLIAAIEPVSDAYYWFGIAHVFEPGYQGIVWDAWQDTCEDALCDALRDEVFRLDFDIAGAVPGRFRDGLDDLIDDRGWQVRKSIRAR